MINLRQLSFLKEGITGICAITLGIAYHISSKQMVLVIILASSLISLCANMYAIKKEKDIEDELSTINRYKATAVSHIILLLVSTIFAVYLFITGKSVTLDFGHIWLFIGSLLIVRCCSFTIIDRLYI